jgi:putative FmdB family regulatory protein
MATYVYNCRQCTIFTEVLRPVNEPEVLPVCETCGELMRRVYSPVPVQFKGTGFYKTGG